MSGAVLSARLVLSNLNNDERAFLAACQTLYRAHRGCSTPFEQFIGALIGHVEHGLWPSPEDVRGELEEFERNWSDMRNEAPRFVQRYKVEDGATEESQSA